MKLDQYQVQALRTACYPRFPIPWLYPALALAEEAGEVSGKLAKMVRKTGANVMQEDVRQALKKELGDVLWNVAALSHELGFQLSEVASCNLEKLTDREKRDVLKGIGDDR